MMRILPFLWSLSWLVLLIAPATQAADCATAKAQLQSNWAKLADNTARITELSKAQAACPKDTAILYNLGLAQYQAGLKTKAKASWQTVLKQQPTHKKAQQNLATVTREIAEELEKEELLDGRIAALPAIRDDQKHHHAYALIIGVGDYQHISKLPYAERDAKNMRDLLIKRGRFLEQNITTRTGADATYMTLFNDFNALVRKGNRYDDSEILFYFSGHGSPLMQQETATDGLLLPVDSQLGSLSDRSALSVSWLKKELNTIKSPNVISILDACFTGNGRSIANGKLGRIAVSSEFLRATQGKALAVAAQKQAAQEYKEGKQGAFSYFLLEALLGQANAQEDWIYLDEAYQYTKRKLGDLRTEQDPHLSGGSHIKLVLKP